MNDLSPRVYMEILRSDLGYFAHRCFCELNPQAAFLPIWHIEVIGPEPVPGDSAPAVLVSSSA